MTTVKYVVYVDGNDRMRWIEPTLPQAWARMEAMRTRGVKVQMERIEEDEE